MNSRWVSGEFETEISYKDWPITLLVGYDFYTGTTRAMGDDPSEIELEYAIDGTNKNVLDKLPKETIEILIDLAFEHGLNNADEHLYY
jgi:hypothetical protein